MSKSTPQQINKVAGSMVFLSSALHAQPPISPSHVFCCALGKSVHLRQLAPSRPQHEVHEGSTLSSNWNSAFVTIC